MNFNALLVDIILLATTSGLFAVAAPADPEQSFFLSLLLVGLIAAASLSLVRTVLLAIVHKLSHATRMSGRGFSGRGGKRSTTKPSARSSSTTVSST